MLVDHQMHLKFGWDTLSSSQKQAFLNKLNSYGLTTLNRQRALLQEKQNVDVSVYKPLKNVPSVGSKVDEQLGEKWIAEGKVGCLILSGGQGTRLGSSSPKGTFPVSPVQGKSLFQLQSERVVCAGKKYSRDLPLVIMTSPINCEETRQFFEQHASFGLSPEQLTFFVQGMLPFLDANGNWLLQEPGVLAEGPDGNGNILKSFYEQGIWEKWHQSGVEYVNVIFIDNPLADPFDSSLIGFTARQKLDVGMKVIERCDVHEKMGIVLENGDRLKVVEYSEFAPEETLEHRFASPGLFCFSMQYIRSLYQEQRISSPLHLACKKAHVIPAGGETAVQMDVYKCETFQFDLLDFTAKSAALLYPRERTYAPLKNAEGKRGPESVREALLRYDREVYIALSGLSAPSFVFELDPVFYYPSEHLKRRMRGQNLPGSGYITENL